LDARTRGEEVWKEKQLIWPDFSLGTRGTRLTPSPMVDVILARVGHGNTMTQHQSRLHSRSIKTTKQLLSVPAKLTFDHNDGTGSERDHGWRN
jgi:hypothetical protein